MPFKRQTPLATRKQPCLKATPWRCPRPRVQDCVQPPGGFSQDLPFRKCIRARWCAKPLSHEPPGNTPPIDLPVCPLTNSTTPLELVLVPRPSTTATPPPPSKQFVSPRPSPPSKIEGFCWPPACVSQTINNVTAGVSLTGMFIVLLTGRR